MLAGILSGASAGGEIYSAVLMILKGNISSLYYGLQFLPYKYLVHFVYTKKSDYDLVATVLRVSTCF